MIGIRDLKMCPFLIFSNGRMMMHQQKNTVTVQPSIVRMFQNGKVSSNAELRERVFGE